MRQLIWKEPVWLKAKSNWKTSSTSLSSFNPIDASVDWKVSVLIITITMEEFWRWSNHYTIVVCTVVMLMIIEMEGKRKNVTQLQVNRWRLCIRYRNIHITILTTTIDYPCQKKLQQWSNSVELKGRCNIETGFCQCIPYSDKKVIISNLLNEWMNENTVSTGKWIVADVRSGLITS